MAKTESKMLALGTLCPPFSLQDTEGQIVTEKGVLKANGLLVMFICNHCPYVKHVADELARLGKDCERNQVGVVAINSNDVQKYPDDHPLKMKEEKKARGYTFSYLFDETQAVAKAFDAACTPEFYLFDGSAKLVYRGQLDDSRPGSDKPVNGKDLRDAIDALVNNRKVDVVQKPSIGCNIKWKS